MRRLLSVAVLLLSGCASAGRMATGNFTTPIFYDRAGITEESFRADLNAVLLEATADSWITSPQMRSSFVANRLRAQGYRIVQPEQAPGPWACFPRD